MTTETISDNRGLLIHMKASKAHVLRVSYKDKCSYVLKLLVRRTDRCPRVAKLITLCQEVVHSPEANITSSQSTSTSSVLYRLKWLPISFPSIFDIEDDALTQLGIGDHHVGNYRARHCTCTCLEDSCPATIYPAPEGSKYPNTRYLIKSIVTIPNQKP